MSPPLIGGGIKWCFCLASVCLRANFTTDSEARLTDDVEVDGDGGGTEPVGGFARVPPGVGRLDVGDVQPRARPVRVVSLPAEVDAGRVLGPRDERTRVAVDRTRDAHCGAELGHQRRRVVRLHVRRLLFCTTH